MSSLAEADALFVEGEYEGALGVYGKVILNASSAEAFDARARRSACLTKLGRMKEALADADAALALRDDVASVHHHRAEALHSVGRHAEALQSLMRARQLLDAADPASHATLSTAVDDLTGRCKSALALQSEAPEGVAHVEPSAAAGIASMQLHSSSASSDVSEVGDALAALASPPSAASTAGSTPAATSLRPRYDWYQNLTHATVTVWTKGVVEEASSVYATGHELAMSLTTGDGEVAQLQLRLYGAVAPDSPVVVTYRPTKVEVRLAKAKHDMWPTLERPPAGAPAIPAAMLVHAAAAADPRAAAPAGDAAKAAATPAASGVPSAYASKKDWGALERELEKEAAEDDGGAAGGGAGGEEALQSLFRKIYAGADEDTRRAMVKSFVSAAAALGDSGKGNAYRLVNSRLPPPRSPHVLHCSKRLAAPYCPPTGRRSPSATTRRSPTSEARQAGALTETDPRVHVHVHRRRLWPAHRAGCGTMISSFLAGIQKCNMMHGNQ